MLSFITYFSSNINQTYLELSITPDNLFIILLSKRSFDSAMNHLKIRIIDYIRGC